MRLISWNVNGLRACVEKGFLQFFGEADADAFCVQETKLQEGQIQLDLPGYRQYWNYAEKKGYSGTAVFSKTEPVSVAKGMGVDAHEHEGRVLTLEYPEWYLVCVYSPNSQRELTRLSYRMTFEDDFRAYLKNLETKKPVITCGDMNVAHNPIDLKNARSNEGNAGYTREEREKMTVLLESGFTDSFRSLYPEKTDAYTWWSYMGRAREKNVGWRIDYFLLSNALKGRVKDAVIYPQVMGSDHCPIGLEII